MSEPKIVKTYTAAATLNLGGSEGLIVRMRSGLGTIRTTTAATQEPVGVIWHADNVAGGDVSVVELGECWAIAGATFAAGSTRWAMSNATGQVIPFTGLSTNAAVGKVLVTAAVATSDRVPFLVRPQFITSN